MSKKLVTAMAGALLMLAVDARAQQIVECKAALSTLVNTGQLQNVGTLVKGSCNSIMNGVWLNGTGTKSMECEAAWKGLNLSSEAAAAGKEFVTRNCPAIYQQLGWRTGPAASPQIPACAQAYNALSAVNLVAATGNLVKNRCQQMFTAGWLAGTGITNATACDTPWSRLNTLGGVAAAQSMVNHNCPFMYKNGWLAPGYLQ